MWGRQAEHKKANGTQRKGFVPFFAQGAVSAEYASVGGVSVLSRCPQTEVATFIAKRQSDIGHLAGPYDVYPADVVKDINYGAIGQIFDSASEYLGSGFMISHHYMVLPRHVLEGEGDIRALRVRFGYYFESREEQVYRPIEIVEDNIEADYAIIGIGGAPGSRYGCMAFDSHEKPGTTPSSSSLILLHHPLGRRLRVSVDMHSNGIYSHPSGLLQIYHDTDFGSSGGVYLDLRGRCCAMHLGCEVEGNFLEFNLSRYALTSATILARYPRSLFADFIRQELSPDRVIRSRVRKLELEWVDRRFIEVEMRDRRKRELAKKAHVQSRRDAAGRTIQRLERFSLQAYEVMSVRALAAHFPELGPAILSNRRNHTTDTNKTLFINPITHWYVCYDIEGQYNTVHIGRPDGEIRITDEYVALDRARSADGREAKFHFRNVSGRAEPRP